MKIMKVRLVGVFMLLSMLIGVLSVSPAIDSAEYLTEAAANSNQVILASIHQFLLALIYIVIALLLYPILKGIEKNFAIGFLSFRIIASTLMIVGTVLLLSILLISQGYTSTSNHNAANLEIIGNMLKHTRDYFNHIFMVLFLGVSNLILYYIFFKSKIVPQWISVWGLLGTALSIIASILLLFQVVEVITLKYLILNAPTAVLELILGLWLLFKGFEYRALVAIE